MSIQVWKIPINSQRPDFLTGSSQEFLPSKAEHARQFCFREGWVGIGWSVPSLAHDLVDHAEYLSALDATPQEILGFSARDARGSCKALADDMQVDDFVWCRAVGNIYWLGRISGPWRYFHTGDFSRFDIHQARACRWQKIGAADNVPGPIINAFAGRGMAISRIRNNEAVALLATALIWESRAQEIVKLDGPSIGDRWLNSIAHDNLEDIVALYLQLEKKWIVIPSTVKKSTPYTEMVLRNKKAERAYVQVKSGSTKVEIDSATIPDDVDKFYVFYPTLQELDPQSGDPRVAHIKPSELLQFVKNNRLLMPKFVQFLLDRT